jgi:plasmid stabilization system protein ParE
MKAVLTEEAFRNLQEIRSYLAVHYPAVVAKVEDQIGAIFRRLEEWPESPQAVLDRPGIRKVPLVRYPYIVFYRVVDQTVEVLYIHHSARREPWADDGNSAAD